MDTTKSLALAQSLSFAALAIAAKWYAVPLVLALATLAALRRRAKIAPALVWLLVVETLTDLGTALTNGVHEHLLGQMSGITWLILAYYVPLMSVALF